jgi:hypothetical protein
MAYVASDYSAKITRPAQRNLAGDIDALMIEKFDGKVYMEYQKDSITDGAFDMPTLTGTNTLSNAAMGKPTLTSVVPGIEPDSSKVEIGDVIVQVKTPIISRVIEPMLENVQDRLNVKGRLPKEQAKVIAKAKDQILLHRCVKSSMKTTGVGEITTIPGGFTHDLAVGKDTDPAALLAGLATIALHLADNEIEVSDGVVYILPAQFFALLNADKLIDSDFTKDNGDFANAKVDKAYGLRLVMTTRLPQAENASHIMGTDYNVSLGESDCVMCFAARDAIMSAQSIPLTSDVYWDKKTLSYFIDSYMAFGTAVARPDEAAAIFLYRA